MPEYKPDPTLKKKTADGPLIFKDDIFEKTRPGSNIVRGAALLNHESEIFDKPIEKVIQSEVKPLHADEKFLKKFIKTAKSLSKKIDQDFILFTIVNEAYINLTLNWLYIVVPINSIHMTKEKYAFDPMVVYSTNASKKLFIEMKERLENQHGLMDQEVLNDLCSTQFHGVVCRHFEWSEVADGKWFKLSDHERAHLKPYIINNNYYVGVRNKMSRQALNNLWFLTPRLNCNVPKTRKRLAKFV
uniref:Nucleotide-diphospho-sugar transferase domain-containing protein n=1 Tax=Acrobeloides nanus TaxID=290746 RepID=A0A914DW84_9BILA